MYWANMGRNTASLNLSSTSSLRILNIIWLIICYNVWVTSNGIAGEKVEGQNLLWSCDFSRRWLCGAMNVTSQTYFHFGSGETTSEGTGPSDAPDSEYIYLEASWSQQEDRAILRLPRIGIVEEVCLTFYYHMYASNAWDQGNLRVTITRDSVPVWFVSGNKGPAWRQGQVTLPANTINIQFIAARGSGIQSDIAIDDIMVTSGACPSPQPTLIPLPPLPTLEPWPTPPPIPPIDRRTPEPIPPTLRPFTPSPITPEPLPPFPDYPVTPEPLPPFPTLRPATLAPVTFAPITPEPLPPPRPTPTPQPQTERPTPAPQPVTQTPQPSTPTLPQNINTPNPDPPDSACDPRYQYCPSSTAKTLAWEISPRENAPPTRPPNVIITKSNFDWNSEERNGLGFMITQAEGGHWSEVEESGQPLISSNFPSRWLTMYSPGGTGKSSITSRLLKTTSYRGCLEYKAVLGSQASLALYFRQDGVPTAYKVHGQTAFPPELRTVRIPVHDFLLTNMGFYISFKGEVENPEDFVTIDDITLYDDDC